MLTGELQGERCMLRSRLSIAHPAAVDTHPLGSRKPSCQTAHHLGRLVRRRYSFSRLWFCPRATPCSLRSSTSVFSLTLTPAAAAAAAFSSWGGRASRQTHVVVPNTMQEGVHEACRCVCSS